MKTAEDFPIGTWVRAWTTSLHEPGCGEILGWVVGYGVEHDHYTGRPVGAILHIKNNTWGAAVRPGAVSEVLGPVEVAQLLCRALQCAR